MSTAVVRHAAVRCGRCPALIAFAVTEAGRSMPIDVEPDVAGNVAVHVDGAGRIRARVVSRDRPVLGYERLHLPHFATCAAAQRSPATASNVVPLYRKRAARRVRESQVDQLLPDPG